MMLFILVEFIVLFIIYEEKYGYGYLFCTGKNAGKFLF